MLGELVVGADKVLGRAGRGGAEMGRWRPIRRGENRYRVEPVKYEQVRSIGGWIISRTHLYGLPPNAEPRGAESLGEYKQGV